MRSSQTDGPTEQLGPRETEETRMCETDDQLMSVNKEVSSKKERLIASAEEKKRQPRRREHCRAKQHSLSRVCEYRCWPFVPLLFHQQQTQSHDAHVLPF
jgi:hypothetical protein